MPWWQRPLDTLRDRFATAPSPTREHHPESPIPAPVAPPDAWSDVPPLQRTLADPIRPVAINDQFRDSLAAFADPSFLRPLSHHVDPSLGGLTSGLLSPGEPQARGGPELVLPRRGASPAKPRVQRLASWSAPRDELQTVPLEYRDQSSDEPPAPAGAEAETTGIASSTLDGLPMPALSALSANQPSMQRAVASVAEAPATDEPAPAVSLPDPPQAPAAAPPDAPILGARPAPAPLFPLAEPPATSASAPREPAVQRIRYEPVASRRQSLGAPRIDPPVRSDRVVESPVQRATPSDQLTVQSLPERPSPAGPSPERHSPPSRPPLTSGSGTLADTSPIVPAGAIPDSEVPTPLQPAGLESTPAWPELRVSRLVESEPPAAEPEEAGFIDAPLVVAWNSIAPTPPVTVASPTAPAAPTSTRFADAASADAPGFGPAMRIAAPIIAVQRRPLEADARAARPELPVQTQHATAPSGSTLQPPLVVARGPGVRSPGDGFAGEAVGGMSFERMFSGASQTAMASDAPDDRTSVQREVDATPTGPVPPVQAEAAEAAPVTAGAPASVGPAGPASSGANLDEMARRLYEPLAARLREELWLDRERAGLMGDV